MNNNYEIGTTVRGADVGRKDNSHLFVWLDCPKCGRERWVELAWLPKQKVKGLCQKCYVSSLEHSKNWRGGVTWSGGYRCMWVRKDDFFFSMAKSSYGTGGYVLEHRLIMAKHLGRCLHLWEIVHHKNGVKHDNRIENLQLVTDDRHKQITLLENRIARLENRITLLEAENVRLRIQEIPLS